MFKRTPPIAAPYVHPMAPPQGARCRPPGTCGRKSLYSPVLSAHVLGSPMLYTRFERARILGARALQISMGAPGVLDALSTEIDPMSIAVREFEAGRVPLTVRRFLNARD